MFFSAKRLSHRSCHHNWQSTALYCVVLASRFLQIHVPAPVRRPLHRSGQHLSAATGAPAARPGWPPARCRTGRHGGGAVARAALDVPSELVLLPYAFAHARVYSMCFERAKEDRLLCVLCVRLMYSRAGHPLWLDLLRSLTEEGTGKREGVIGSVQLMRVLDTGWHSRPYSKVCLYSICLYTYTCSHERVRLAGRSHPPAPSAQPVLVPRAEPEPLQTVQSDERRAAPPLSRVSPVEQRHTRSPSAHADMVAGTRSMRTRCFAADVRI